MPDFVVLRVGDFNLRIYYTHVLYSIHYTVLYTMYGVCKGLHRVRRFMIIQVPPLLRVLIIKIFSSYVHVCTYKISVQVDKITVYTLIRCTQYVHVHCNTKTPIHGTSMYNRRLRNLSEASYVASAPGPIIVGKSECAM